MGKILFGKNSVESKTVKFITDEKTIETYKIIRKKIIVKMGKYVNIFG